MRLCLKHCVPITQDSNLGSAQQRWRYPLAQWIMGGLLALFSLGNVAWANDPPIYISDYGNPTTINVGESIHFESVWSDEGDFIVEVQVQYCQQGTSVCEAVTLDFIDGTDEPEVGFEIDVPMTQTGIYAYQFRARDEQPLGNPIHNYEDGSIVWQGGSTFTVVDNTTTPDDPVTPPPSSNYTISGTVSLPIGNVAPKGGIDISVITSCYQGNACGNNFDWSKSNTPFIPENQSSTSFKFFITDDPNIKWKLRIHCDDREWDENLAEEVRHDKCRGYVTELWYTLSGMRQGWSDDIFLFSGGQNYPNTKFFLLRSVQISGTVSLPQGKVAPADGLEIYIYAYEPVENGEHSGEHVTIPEGESTIPYTLTVVDNPQKEWIINYVGDGSFGRKGYKHWGYYSSTGTEFNPDADYIQPLEYVDLMLHLPGGQNHSNINLTLIPLDAETPIDEPIDDTQPPTITISEPSGLVFSTEADSINIAGTAEDNVEVVQIVWTNNHGDSGEAVAMTMNDGTMTWSMDNIALQDGENIITVTAYDAAGWYGSANLTVTKVLPDSTLPTVTISSHPPTSVLSNVDRINIAGTASFNEYQKITWENNHGNGGEVFISEMSALIDGTAIWNKNNIPLKIGENIITVTVYDKTGLQSSASLTITLTSLPQQPKFTISNVHPNGSENEREYDRKEKPLTVWWDTSDTSYSTEVLIFLQPVPDDGTQYFMHLTQNDEQETFIISDEVNTGEWKVCLYSVPTQEPPEPICASGNITIQ